VSRLWIEGGYRIGEGWLIPDVSVSWPDQKILDGYAAGSPMIAIEIISQSNTPAYVRRKVAAYHEGGGTEVWVVYPETRSMVAHVRADMRERRYTGTYECGLLNATIPVGDLLS
jgi:Uma2 family endonuclease